MAIAERITSYSTWIGETNYLKFNRNIRLDLESGTIAFIGFPEVRPDPWLSFESDGSITLYLTADQYEQVYHLLQTEKPVFLTAADVSGLQVGAVHTELDLSVGEPTGEGYRDQSLEALIVRARAAR